MWGHEIAPTSAWPGDPVATCQSGVTDRVTSRGIFVTLKSWCRRELAGKRSDGTGVTHAAGRSAWPVTPAGDLLLLTFAKQKKAPAEAGAVE